MISKVQKEFIRNFSIIAHIDHGKSTLADRLMEMAGVTDARSKKDQILDDMDLEREKGITIKSNTVSFFYRPEREKNSQVDQSQYLFNLIDTPGHIDFSYEVSRSLAACEGCLLVIDASQGIQAQTLANYNHARNSKLKIIPIINKIDLPNADYEKTKRLLIDTFSFIDGDILGISAKSGLNVEKVFLKIIENIPPPSGDSSASLRALIYDSYYDSFVGVVMKVKIIDGILRTGDRIRIMRGQKEMLATQIGLMRLKKIPTKELKSGEVGYIISGLKSLEDAQVGDTITSSVNPATEPFPGYKIPQPMIFSSLYAIDNSDFTDFQNALKKLKLNDSALTFEREQNPILGFGFRVGYLGLLHMEIVRERLLREFQIRLIATTPSVEYRLTLSDGSEKKISNPSDWPGREKIVSIKEPFVTATIFCFSQHLGSILQLLQKKRGQQLQINHLNDQSIQLIYMIPLAEIIHDFYDPLKSISEGYASLDYSPRDYQESQLVKISILVNGDPIDALSPVVHRQQANARAKQIIENLKNSIPRQQFQIALQAMVNNKIIVRENISAYRKNVIAKCYGGDITRKRKLLEKQKSGKRKMKQMGKLHISHKVFLSLIKNS